MHQSVLISESIRELVGNKEGTYIDGTFGGGGHSIALLNSLGSKSKLIALDWDSHASPPLPKDIRFSNFHCNFSLLDLLLKREKLGAASVDGILLDLGFSNSQLVGSEANGLSFWNDGFLRSQTGNHPKTAASWFEKATPKAIRQSLKLLGNEKHVGLLMRNLDATPNAKIRTRQFVSTILQTKASKKQNIMRHPATKTFRTVRMVVNDEAENLRGLLVKASDHLKLNGKLVIITFNSVEDRVVRSSLKKDEGCTIRMVRKVFPSELEKQNNHQARSAKAFVLKKAEGLVSQKAQT
ncbi:S-adenosyl-methyltransferase [Candidatus Tremblaya phenacola PAVE]|nr:S-adenosyl-methyltransferase [Candidatus Tremblaya phenacola PAVE]